MRRNSPIPGILSSGTGYAKDCIPLENKCNVTVVTDGGGPGIFRGMGALGSDPRQLQSGTRPGWLRYGARRKDKKFTRADAEKMSARKIGVNRRNTLPADASD